jgi:diguanylate cyclase (GGDEF)-like protein
LRVSPWLPITRGVAGPPTTGLRRRPRLGFATRLFMALTLALIVAGGVQLLLTTAQIERQFIERAAQDHAGDARAVARAYESADRGEPRFGEVAEAVRAIGARAGTEELLVIDATQRVVAASREEELGRRYHDQAVVRALDGRSFAALEEHEGRRHLSLIEPVLIGSRLYVLRSERAATDLDEAIAVARSGSALYAAIGLLLAAGAFYLFGGRSLARTHKAALERARRDGLTGLENHRAFQDELERAWAIVDRGGDPLALVILDIDDFKLENDEHGHRHGDRLLTAVAEVLAEARTADRAFRLGGDEFALLLPSTDAAGAVALASRLHGRLTRALRGATVSLGVATSGAAADSSETLWEQADAALYEAKRRGGNTTVAAEPGELDRPAAGGAERRALHALLEEGAMNVAFQPIWDLDKSEVLGWEALARPQRDHGFAGPGDAFAVAERLGKAPELDMICRELILARAAALPRGPLLFMNVSPQALEHRQHCADEFAAAVRSAGLEPSSVVVEITERSSSRSGRVGAQAARLRQHGFRLALDDVGSGNAGFEMLQSLQVDYVKIDRSVVAGAMSNTSARAVYAAVLAFAEQSGALPIAEGIENEAMLNFVRGKAGGAATVAMRVSCAQGYLLGPPTAEPWDAPEPARTRPAGAVPPAGAPAS